jgi:hypothetical protein
MHIWGFACDCGAEQQTMDHIVNDNNVPYDFFSDGLLSLNEAKPDAVEYLSSLDLNP